MAIALEEGVLYDFRLLLKAIAIERFPVFKHIAVAAERVTHQRKIPAAPGLRLPDMGHLVDEMRLGRA